MPSTQYKEPLSSQPQTPVELDSSHWLVQKGIVFYSPAPGYALSSKGPILPLSHAMPDSPEARMGLTVVGNATNYDTYAINLPGSTPFTLIAWGKVVDTTNDHVLLGVGIAGQNEHRALISMDGADSGGTDRCYAFCKDGTAADQVFTAAGAYTANAWQMVTGVFGSATDMRVYLNGAKEGALTSGVNIPTSMMTRLHVGSTPGVSPNALRNGDRVGGCICVLGALTAAEVSRLYYEQLENPWSLLALQISNVYLPSAGGNFSLSDSGSGSDAISISVSFSLSDAGAGTDLQPSPGAALTLLDDGASADAVSLAALLAVMDTGAGSDADTVSVAFALSDSGSGADAISILTQFLASVSDAASGVDGVSIQAQIALADSGSGADTPVLYVSLSVADSASAADILDVLQQLLISVADAGAGLEGMAIAINVPVGDAGSGMDAPSIQAWLALVESATGMDASVAFNAGGQRIATILFKLAHRAMTFTLAARQISFTLN